MGKIANFIQFSIKQRTAKGYDVDGEAFAPYSKMTKRIREAEGRGTYLVDLNFTGSMLASMTHTAQDDYAEIFFMPSYDRDGEYNPEKAFFLDQGRSETNLPQREFFDVSTYELEKIMDLYEKYGDAHSSAITMNYHLLAKENNFKSNDTVLFVAAGAGITTACVSYTV